MRAWWLFAILLLAGCAHQREVKCQESCKERGLRYVGLFPATMGYDPVERKEIQGEVCRCE